VELKASSAKKRIAMVTTVEEKKSMSEKTENAKASCV